MLTETAAREFTPTEVASLRAGDFYGTIGDPLARRRFDRYNRAEIMLAKHREAGGPLAYLDDLTARIAATGRIETPIEVNADGTIYDGHHRALAAHTLGLPLPWVPAED